MFWKNKKKDALAATRTSFYPTTNGTGMELGPTLAQSAQQSKCLLTGVDSLEVTVGAPSCPSEWLLDQYDIWTQYQDQYELGDEYICIDIDGTWWELYPHGRTPYAFLLKNNEIGFIKVWNPKKWGSALQGSQHLHIKLYSKFLHSNSISYYSNIIKSISSKFFSDVDALSIKISRVDVHSDISRHSMLSQEDIDNTITRTKVKDIWYEDDEETYTNDELSSLSLTNSCNKVSGILITPELAQKLLKTISNQSSVGPKRTLRKRDIETAYFGRFDKSSLAARVYNKTVQVKVKNDDDTPLLWEQNGWNGSDTVIRVEFQLKREFLKQLNGERFVTLDGFISGINSIWEYLTTKWLRFVDEVKYNNLQTSSISSFWVLVQSSFKDAVEVVIRKKVFKGKLNQLFLQSLGCAKQMISIGMLDIDDVGYVNSTISAFADKLKDAFDNGEYHNRRKHLGLSDAFVPALTPALA